MEKYNENDSERSLLDELTILQSFDHINMHHKAGNAPTANELPLLQQLKALSKTPTIPGKTLYQQITTNKTEADDNLC